MLFRLPPTPSLRQAATSWNFGLFVFLFPVCSVNFENLEYFLRKFFTLDLSQTITPRAVVRHSSLTVADVHWRVSDFLLSFCSTSFFFSFNFFFLRSFSFILLFVLDSAVCCPFSFLFLCFRFQTPFFFFIFLTFCGSLLVPAFFGSLFVLSRIPGPFPGPGSALKDSPPPSSAWYFSSARLAATRKPRRKRRSLMILMAAGDLLPPSSEVFESTLESYLLPLGLARVLSPC